MSGVFSIYMPDTPLFKNTQRRVKRPQTPTPTQPSVKDGPKKKVVIELPNKKNDIEKLPPIKENVIESIQPVTENIIEKLPPIEKIKDVVETVSEKLPSIKENVVESASDKKVIIEIPSEEIFIEESLEVFENLQELFAENMTFEENTVVDAGDEKNKTFEEKDVVSVDIAENVTFEDATIDEKQAVEEVTEETPSKDDAENKKIEEEVDAKICDFFKKLSEKLNAEETVVENKTFEDTTVKATPIKKTNPLLAFGQKFKNSNLI